MTTESASAGHASEYVTVKQAAQIAHVSERTIRNWIYQKRIITVKRSPHGRKILIERSQVDPR